MATARCTSHRAVLPSSRHARGVVICTRCYRRARTQPFCVKIYFAHIPQQTLRIEENYLEKSITGQVKQKKLQTGVSVGRCPIMHWALNWIRLSKMIEVLPAEKMKLRACLCETGALAGGRQLFRHRLRLNCYCLRRHVPHQNASSTQYQQTTWMCA